LPHSSVPRVTRGQRGSLLLHCDGLAPSTSCRSPGAPRLDGWPMRSPVNASPRPSRATAHDSGPMWIATPSSQGTCTLYSLPVSRRFAYLVRFTPNSNRRADVPNRQIRANSRHSPRLLTLNREAPHCAARLPTWQNNPLGETVPGMQGLKRVGRDRVGTLSSSIAVLQ